MLALMARRSIGAAALVLVLVAGCSAEHKYAAEWEESYDACLDFGTMEQLAGDVKVDPDLVEDACSKMVADLSQEYQDTPPNDIPYEVRKKALDEAVEDCADQDALESDYC